ncbi:MAG: hypothetical protein JWM88_3034 [Verrucomicrobia bacterium]|nr:hypothetical protein [Verrucomicrobiota bacterium]
MRWRLRQTLRVGSRRQRGDVSVRIAPGVSPTDGNFYHEGREAHEGRTLILPAFVSFAPFVVKINSVAGR